jgi:MSHA biogenesis protein MshO
VVRKIRGFTLIELIIAIVVIGIIAAAATPVMIGSMGAYNATLDTAMTLDKLRYASERMAREIREIDTSKPVTMSATALQFTRDDYAGTTNSIRDVSITQSAKAVNLSYRTPTVPPIPLVTPAPVLTDQLSALVFRYFDINGDDPSFTALPVRYVEIKLILKIVHDYPVSETLYAQRTRVALRNRSP